MSERVETTSIRISFGGHPYQLSTFSIVRDLAAKRKHYPAGLNAYGAALYDGDRDKCDRLWRALRGPDPSPFPKLSIWRGWLHR